MKITVTADVPLKAYMGVSYGRFGVFARTVHKFLDTPIGYQIITTLRYGR